jgi:flagellar motor switch protein FliN/FliY
MTPTTTLTDARATAAADAAVGLLPAPTPLTVGVPTNEPVAVFGQAISARFAGSATGEIVVVVGPELVGALAMSPLGALDITQAVRPALEAAAATLGPVVVDPGNEGDPADAMRAILDAGGLLVPLTDDGQVRALVALAVDAQIGGTPEAAPPADPGAAPDAAGAAGAGGGGAGADGTGADTAAGAGAGGGSAAVPAGFAPLTAAPRNGAPAVHGGLHLLHDVEMEVTAELGRTRMSVRELLSLAPGVVIELDRLAGGPADLLVNGRLIARGEVVVIDENFGIRITEIVTPS